MALAWFDSVLASTAAVVVSYFVALLSYTLIEKPIHLRRAILTDRSMTVVAVLCIIVPFAAGLGLVQAWQNGWWRPVVQELQATTTVPHLDTREGCADISGIGPGSGSCLFEVPDSRGTILLVGDSNAGMYAEPLRVAANQRGYSLEVATRNACPVQLGGHVDSTACEDFVAEVIDSVHARTPPYSLVVVVNAGRYAQAGYNFSSLAAANAADGSNPKGYAISVAKALDEINRSSPTLVLLPIPQKAGDYYPACVLPSVLLSRPDFACTEFDSVYLKSLWRPTTSAIENATSSGTTVFDPTPMLCTETAACSMVVSGQLVYRDNSHLSVEGSLLLTDELGKAMQDAMRDASQ